MTSLRTAAFLVSLALHGAVAMALLQAGGDALDSGAGTDLLRVELGLAAQGLHDSGSDIESVDGTDMPAAAESVAQEQIENVAAVEEPPREPPPNEIEPAKVAEVIDEVIASEQGPEAEIAPETVPEIAREKPLEKQEASIAQQASEQERRAVSREQRGGEVAENRAYFRLLSRHLERRKVNPRSRLTGTVVVSFTVDPAGRVMSRQIAKSSGSKVLDEAALASVERASPFPPFPEGVRGDSLSLTVPFRFVTR